LMACCKYLADYKKSSPVRQLKRRQLSHPGTTKRALQAGAIRFKNLDVPQ
jgi:hypothetical protein